MAEPSCESAAVSVTQRVYSIGETRPDKVVYQSDVSVWYLHAFYIDVHCVFFATRSMSCEKQK